MFDYAGLHLPSCMLKSEPYDLACFTASEIECTCRFEERANAEIGHLRELLSDALKALSGRDDHASGCAIFNAPAYNPLPCNCSTRMDTSGVVNSLPEAWPDTEAG